VRADFEGELWRYPGPGGWTFVTLPASEALDFPVTGAFGRTPVVATVDGRTWETSLWRDRERGVLLAVPARIRGGKIAGDRVRVSVVFAGRVG
jgi:hypothetical protein